ncbi:DHBP synthase RibB-like alpha/beta domain-containing protein, partial [Paraphysoderma sedebokerense]
VVAMPTETVYGLAANALSPNAISKIFHAKSRPSDNPLIIHISSLHMLKSLLPGGKIPPSYLPLIQRFWPGPLTLLFPKSDSIPDIITASQPTVAIRFPSHPITRTLISLCGFPLAAPSANSSGKPSPTLAQHVYEDLKGKIPLIIDGGQCNYGIESTVLDGLRDPPVILRPGGVTAEMAKEIPGYEHVRVYKKDFVDRQMEETPTTPGMKYRHYSPEAEVILVNLNFDRSRPSDYKHALMKQKSVLEKELKIVSAKPNESSSVIARELFKGLRWLDSQKVDLLFIQGVEESDEGLAIMNRVRKAASKVI